MSHPHGKWQVEYLLTGFQATLWKVHGHGHGRSDAFPMDVPRPPAISTLPRHGALRCVGNLETGAMVHRMAPRGPLELPFRSDAVVCDASAQRLAYDEGMTLTEQGFSFQEKTEMPV